MGRLKTLAAPRLLLGLGSLQGTALATRDRQLEIVARYREPEGLAVLLSKTMSAGADGVLTIASAAVLAALAELKTTVRLFVIVPALNEYDRQHLAPGLESSIEASGGRANGSARMRMGLAGLARPAALFRGQMSRRLPVLLEAELAGLPRGSLSGVVLDPWFTDLALAAGNGRVYESYIRFVRRRFRVPAGLETRNLGVLLGALREWEIRPDFVVGPLNPSGLLMKPSPEELLAEVERSQVPVVARELTAGGVESLEHAATYARAHGVHGLAPDISEMDDVGTELRTLGRQGALPMEPIA